METIIAEIAQDVYVVLGPGHSEIVYCRAIGIGLQRRGIVYETEKTMPVTYMDSQVGTCRLDLVIGGLVVELKCVSAMTNMHKTQLRRYLNLLGLLRGMLVNFGPNGLDMVYVEKECV